MSSCVERGGLGDLWAAVEGSVEALHARHVPFLDSGRLLGAVEHGERGAQCDAGRDGVVFQDAAQAREGERFEFAHFVEEAFVAITADLVDGLLEVGIAFEPVIDGRAVDADGIGSSGHGAAASQGHGSFGLIERKRANGVAGRDGRSGKGRHRGASTFRLHPRCRARGSGVRQGIEKTRKIPRNGT